MKREPGRGVIDRRDFLRSAGAGVGAGVWVGVGFPVGYANGVTVRLPGWLRVRATPSALA